MEIKNEQAVKNEQMKIKNKSRTRLFIVLTVMAISIIIGYIIFRGSYLETLEIGEKYINIFWQNIKYMSITLLCNFAFIYSAFYITNLSIKKGLKEFFDQEKKQMPKLLNKSISFIVALIVSSLTSSMILEKAMICFNSTQFGAVDPIFGLDIGYFIFVQPFIEFIIWYLLITAIVLLIYTVIYYIVVFNMYFDGVDRKTLKNSKLIKYTIFAVMIIAVLISLLVFVKTENIETDKFLTLTDESSTYSLYGAGITDATIKLWGYRILSIVIIVSVYMSIKAFKQGKTKKIILSVAIVSIYLVILFFVMLGYQTIFVSNNELDKQKQYIETNIKYTKNAYGINIEEINLDANTDAITSQSLKQYENIINNVAIVNKDTVQKDLKIGQTAKGYYNFPQTQIGKYMIDGKEELVYLSPREITNSSNNYNNKTYEYTHGYGTIITSATTTKENGNLYHIQKSFDKTDDVIAITEPRIYFGMQTNQNIVTNTKDKKEFDYPILNSSFAENAENTYNGNAGLNLNFADRLILGIKEGDIQLAFSGNLTQNSKILTNRNILKRVKTIMPYLMYDENPYTVITDDGKIVWVLDAYTISNNYPYSQVTTIRESATSKLELNYIRNSVKVLIDSYNGDISFYITDRTDPIAMAYRNIYPDLFVDLNETIPADISAHFIYPKYLYNIQANIVTRYHNIQPDVLYRNDDIWEIATYNTGKVITKTGTDIEPYYTMVKLNNEEEEKLALVLPYTPEGRQNLISYLIAICDNSANSKLTIYKYPADTNILGPMQLDTQIAEDETIKAEIDALNVNGSKVSKNIIIVPLDNTLLYIEPIYSVYLNEDDALPTLKKVVVASGNKVAIGDNLKQALNNLISQNAVNIEVENTDTIEDLIDTIIKANKNLTNSNENNNWEMVGKDISKLQELINKLEVLVNEENMRKEAEKQENEQLNVIEEQNITINQI